MKVIPLRPDLGQQYKNEFKEKGFYPFTQISRVLADSDTGEILTELNELDSRFTKAGIHYNIDENKHGIFLKIPPFYCKRNWKGELLEDSFLAEIPPNTTAKIPEWITRLGFEIWPSFIRQDGTVREYILYGAFKGSLQGNKLMSLPYKQPLVNKNIIQMREHARSGRNEKWNIETFGTFSMMQFLYKIAFQDLDSQKIIGQGWTNKTQANKTGTTMSIGNRSGFGNTDWGIEQGYDAPDPRICFIMGVQDGKFKYWSKDPNIKPEGIDGAINQFDNGVVTSESGDFALKVNEDSIYTGVGYKNYFEINAARGPSNMIKEFNSLGETIISCNSGTTTAGMPFAVGSNTVLQCEIGDYVSGECEIYLETWDNNDIPLIINNGSSASKTLIKNQWVKISFECQIITERNKTNSLEFFIGRNGITEINFTTTPLKFKVRNGFIAKTKSLKFKIKNEIVNPKLKINLPSSTATHSFIVKNYNDLKKTSIDRWVLWREETGEDCRFWTSEQIINRNVLISNNYQTQDVNIRNKGIKSNFLFLNSRGGLNLTSSDSFQSFICYEGNLTEQELKVELNKNLKIPEVQNTQPIPNSNGESNNYFGKYTNTTTDFPLIPNSFYLIKDSKGILHTNKIEPDHTIIGTTIQILSGKIRVLGISAPYELKIVPSFPFENQNGFEAPDKSCVGAIMADSTGLKSWFAEPGVKIKGIENARVVEETDDYMIICDGIVTTVENYVTGTYDLYKEKLASVEKTKDYKNIPLVAPSVNVEIDHVALLNKINNEQLSAMATPLKKARKKMSSFVTNTKHSYLFKENWKHIKINEEIQIHYEDNGTPIENFELTTPNDDLVRIDGHTVIGLKAGTAVISTSVASFCLIVDEEAIPPKNYPYGYLEPRAIPIPVDFCCRVDKKTGEIYIGEGYENFHSLMHYSHSSFSAVKNTYNHVITVLGGSQHICSLIWGTPNTDLSGSFEYSGTIKIKINGNGTYSNNKVTLLHPSTAGAGAESVNLVDSPVVGDILHFNNMIITKTSTPKPFVKTQMPSGKMSILSSATSDTHSFVMKGLNGKVKPSGIFRIYQTNQTTIGFERAHIIGIDTAQSDIIQNNNALISNKYAHLVGINKQILIGDAGVSGGAFITSPLFGTENCYSLHQILIYKGNLTEAQLKAENTKKINLSVQPFSTPQPPKEPIKNGLICWLDGRDGKGTETIWVDRSGNGNNATLTNFNFTADSGWTGKSLKFDGINDIATIPFNDLSLAVELRIILKPSSFEGFFGSNRFEHASKDEGNVSFIENKLKTFYWNGGYLNIDNVVRKEGDIVSIYMHNTNTCINGVKSNFDKRTFWGYIMTIATYCSVRVYNRALTDSEIKQNYDYEQSVDRTVPTVYPLVEEVENYGIGLANQLTKEQLETFRLSNDKTKFVAGLNYCEGLTVDKYTYTKTLEIMETPEWSSNEVIANE